MASGDDRNTKMAVYSTLTVKMFHNTIFTVLFIYDLDTILNLRYLYEYYFAQLK